MKPIFTIHAGEYLVGSYIEQHFKDWRVWIPSKDTGIDFLVSNADNSKTTSIQVKFSKDFLVTHGKAAHQGNLISCGWWTLNRQKIKNSTAEFWVFVLHTFNEKNMQYVIIQPQELYRRLDLIHSTAKTLQSYLWVTTAGKCWEARGLKKEQQNSIANADTGEIDEVRDFTEFLNNWKPLAEKLT
jgi:hypothetical protein